MKKEKRIQTKLTRSQKQNSLRDLLSDSKPPSRVQLSHFPQGSSFPCSSERIFRHSCFDQAGEEGVLVFGEEEVAVSVRKSKRGKVDVRHECLSLLEIVQKSAQD